MNKIYGSGFFLEQNQMILTYVSCYSILVTHKVVVANKEQTLLTDSVMQNA